MNHQKSFRVLLFLFTPSTVIDLLIKVIKKCLIFPCTRYYNYNNSAYLVNTFLLRKTKLLFILYHFILVQCLFFLTSKAIFLSGNFLTIFVAIVGSPLQRIKIFHENKFLKI